LDEKQIQKLKKEGSTINVWGVGTNLATAKGQAALGGVYKLAAIEKENGEWNYKIKLSETPIKTSNPGIQSIRRFFDKRGRPLADQIYDPAIGRKQTTDLFDNEAILAEEEITTEEDLLVKVMEKGKIVYTSPSIHEIREISLQQQKLFEDFHKEPYPVGLEQTLSELKAKMIHQYSSEPHEKY